MYYRGQCVWGLVSYLTMWKDPSSCQNRITNPSLSCLWQWHYLSHCLYQPSGLVPLIFYGVPYVSKVIHLWSKHKFTNHNRSTIGIKHVAVLVFVTVIYSCVHPARQASFFYGSVVKSLRKKWLFHNPIGPLEQDSNNGEPSSPAPSPQSLSPPLQVCLYNYTLR